MYPHFSSFFLIFPHPGDKALAQRRGGRVVVLDRRHDARDELEKHEQVVLHPWRDVPAHRFDQFLHNRRVFTRVNGRRRHL